VKATKPITDRSISLLPTVSKVIEKVEQYVTSWSSTTYYVIGSMGSGRGNQPN